ncbi:MAG: response regulator [Planctomycetota bacterium]
MTRVLFADDCNLSRTLAQLGLRRGGLDVLLARDGEEALVLAADHDVRVAIVKLDLPVRTGLEVTRELVARGVRVILTGRALGEATRRDCLAAGASAVLELPMSPEAMLAAVLGSGGIERTSRRAG